MTRQRASRAQGTRDKSGATCRTRRLGSGIVTDACRTDDPGRRPAQVVRQQAGHRRGGEGHRRRRTARRVVRLPRPQRRRQVLDDADDRGGLADQRRRAADPRAWTRPPTAPAIRARIGVCPQEDTLDTELNVSDNLYVYGRYFGHPAGRGAPARRGAARVRAAHREGEVQGRGPLRRHEAPAHHRPLADQPARGAAARRADDRPRPAGPPRRLGPAVPAQAAGRDASC